MSIGNLNLSSDDTRATTDAAVELVPGVVQLGEDGLCERLALAALRLLVRMYDQARVAVVAFDLQLQNCILIL